MTLISPLRYPGGKNRLSKFIAHICTINNINGHYVEPYAGGAAVALHLLLGNYVKKITINDLDRAIFAFWHCVLYCTDEFCDWITKTNITIHNWKLHRATWLDRDTAPLFDLGCATFFLNRTCRSGILAAGVIGGLKQDGLYRIDERFNKSDLICRIQRIAEYRAKITNRHLDAMVLIQNIRKNNNTLFYLDPPYYTKGPMLYMNHYQNSTHKEVAHKITHMKKSRWIVSYDDVPEIRRLYHKYTCKSNSFFHMAHRMVRAKEVMYFSDNLVITDQ